MFGLHPLQTFAAGAGETAFAGAGCAIAGSTHEALGVAESLARRLGMTPFEIEDEQRAAYHAAASVASNFLITLQAAAEEIAGGVGHRDEARRCWRLWCARAWRTGLPAALRARSPVPWPAATRKRWSGSATRSRPAPQLLDLFDALVERTRALAGSEVPA